MHWEDQRDGAFYAKSGKRIIGMVVPLSDGTGVVWDISAVAGSKYQPAARGQCATIVGAKRAFRRAWRIWLEERGLAEAKDAAP